MSIGLESLTREFLKQAQAQEIKAFQPKYTHPIRPQISDINLAINEMNAAKSQIPADKTIAVGAINKCTQYLQWYRTVGISGNVSAVGKDQLIPSREEMLNIVRTGLFGPEFIISLASLLKLNEAIPQIKTEFDKLQ